MGFIQKDAFRTMILSYSGLILGYLNKGYLFIHLLSTDQVGLVNLIIAVGLLIAQLSNLGSVYAIWKFFPFFRNEEKRHYGFLLMNMILVSFGILLCVVAVVFFQSQISLYYSENSKLFVDFYYLIIPVGIATVYFLLFENYMRGLNKNILPVFLNEFIMRLLLTFLLIAYALKWISFDVFLFAYAFSHFLPTIYLAIYLIRIKEISFSIKSISVPKRFRKIVVTFSLFSYLNSIGALIVVTLDAIMLAQMVGLRATGVYTTVIFLISAIQVPYKSLLRTSSPLIPVYWRERKMNEMNVLYKKVSSISLLIVLLLFSLVWVSRIQLFSLLPDEYMQGISVFFFLMIGRILDMYFGLNGIIFVTSKKYKYDIIFTSVMIFTVFFLNLWLIPIYGMTGAAISTAIALVVYNIGRVLFVYFIYQMHPFEWNQLKILVLFFTLLYFFECFFPFIPNVLLGVSINSILFTVCFLCPIFYLGWNKDLNNYALNGLSFIRSKLRKNRSKSSK